MSYPGGKASPGTYQRLINLIPPHKEYVAPFAGLDAIARHIYPAPVSVFCDLDGEALARLRQAVRQAEPYPASRDYRQECGIQYLRRLIRSAKAGPRRPDQPYGEAPQDGRRFIYADPPYPMSTRSGGRLYRYELEDKDHAQLLDALEASPWPAMVSTYPNKLYAERLASWEAFTYPVTTRGGIKTETTYANYPPPAQLHDYAHLGANKRAREMHRKRAANLVGKLERLPEIERNHLLAHVAEAFGLEWP